MKERREKTKEKKEAVLSKRSYPGGRQGKEWGEDKRKEGKLKRRRRQGIKHGTGSHGEKQEKVHIRQKKRGRKKKEGEAVQSTGRGRQGGGMGSAEG
jgi:hypothetical protein